MRRPFLMFAIADHRSDTALRLCSAEARGVWIDMLCLMAEGEPYGHLSRPDDKKLTKGGTPGANPVSTSRGGTRGANPVSTSRGGARGANPVVSFEPYMAQLTNTPEDVVKRAIRELERYGVFNRVADGPLKGIIYSRRMLRDQERYQERSKAQKARQQAASGRNHRGAPPLGPKQGLTPLAPGVPPPEGLTPLAPGVPPLITRTRTIDKNNHPQTPSARGGGLPSAEQERKEIARRAGELKAARRKHD